MFSGQNIEHLWADEVAGFLMEAARTLRPGGTLVVDSPNRTITAALNWSHPEHTIELTVPEIRDLLLLAGFEVTKQAGLWLCQDPRTGRMLPYDPNEPDAEWSVTERLLVAQAHPQQSFLWWLEGRRTNAAPDRPGIQALLAAAYAEAWPERLRRLRVIPGFAVQQRAGKEWVVVPAGATGVVFYGPYAPMRAGQYRIGFTIEPDTAATGVLAVCDICLAGEVLERQDVGPQTRSVVFQLTLDALRFGAEFRCISVAGGFSVLREVEVTAA
jgi:hypothetical protein